MKHQQQVEELMTNMKGCITLKPHDAKSRPESVVINTIHINDIIWSELEIVRNIFYLNLAFGSTMAIGVVSLIMEIFIAWYYKDERGRWNWKNTYFHQNLQKTKAMTKRSLKKITKPFDLGPRVMKNPNLRESGF